MVASEQLGQQLAALAAASVAKPARRRGVVVASVTAGVLALGIGTAWASGSIEVPGLPQPGRHAPADPTRDRPETPVSPGEGQQDKPVPGHSNMPGAMDDQATEAPPADRPDRRRSPEVGATTAPSPSSSTAPSKAKGHEKPRPDKPVKPEKPTKPTPEKPEKPTKTKPPKENRGNPAPGQQQTNDARRADDRADG